MPSTTIRTAFLSSTGRDLAAHREAAYKAINGLKGWKCVRMEDFGARAGAPLDVCCEEVRESHLFVGILGLCYGSAPPGDETSFTEHEYDAAVDVGLSRLMFVSPDDFPLPGHLIEPDAQRSRQKAFRDRVSAEVVRASFSVPEQLAAAVIQAIRNWEEEERRKAPSLELPAAAVEKLEAGPTMLPKPPEPFFAHPYPLQQSFTGRVAERRRLSMWFASDARPILVLEAIGGMGKSAVTWAWLHVDLLGDDSFGIFAVPRIKVVQQPKAIVWWSFYGSLARFENFVSETLAYLGLDLGQLPSAHNRVRALRQCLQNRSILLVLDGFERELRAYAGLDAAYRGDREAAGEADPRACVDPAAAQFFREIRGLSLKGRVLITSRLLPKELEGGARVDHVALSGLDPGDAVAFFHAQGVKGIRAEIEAVCAPRGYYPLILRLLTGLATSDLVHPSDVRALAGTEIPESDMHQDDRRHHVMEVAYNALSEDLRTLLGRIAAFRASVTYETLKAIENERGDLDLDLKALLGRGLLMFDVGSRRFDLHPIVRRYAYERLTDRKSLHARLRDHFAVVSTTTISEVRSLDDLAPLIELYHHTVRAGEYDKACDLYYERLWEVLHYRLGAYELIIELLSDLLPDSEEQQMRLTEPNDQAWTLSTLAAAYWLTGQGRPAVRLKERATKILETSGDELNLAISLRALAISAVPLGSLQQAEAALIRSIELSRKSKDACEEAIGHHELGRLRTLQGDAGGTAILDRAAKFFRAQNHVQLLAVVEAWRAEASLLFGNPAEALAAARRARDRAEETASTRYSHLADCVRADLLIGRALLAGVGVATEDRCVRLTEAESRLRTALAETRGISLVELEPEILLALAGWYRLKEDASTARATADEALEIADRCEYRLVQADINNFLARLALDGGDKATAHQHAEIAAEHAWCDGPPHSYKSAWDEAQRLLTLATG